jgi:hypothetical protein
MAEVVEAVGVIQTGGVQRLAGRRVTFAFGSGPPVAG